MALVGLRVTARKSGRLSRLFAERTLTANGRKFAGALGWLVVRQLAKPSVQSKKLAKFLLCR